MDISYIINELGEDRDQYFQAIAPPIVQTSNFRVKRVDDLRRLFADEFEGFIYSRGQNPTVSILRKKLAALDGAEDCLVFSSGAAAIFAAVFSQVKTGDHLVSVAGPYTSAQRTFDRILPRFGISTSYVAGNRLADFEEAIRPNTRLIYLESPNSWDFRIQDLGGVASLARSRGIVTVIDNSYCTPLYQRPLDYGIDLSIQTATKYIGGHSDTLGGVLCGSRALIKGLFEPEYMNIGSGIQPFNAWLLIRGLRTLPARLERISRSTREVLKYLKQAAPVSRVLFPLDPDFPQFELAQKQMKGACGLISFTVRAETRAQIVRFCESLQHILMAVSWGGHESLILPKCASLPDESFDPGNPDHTLLRLYVGLEDPGYLISDLAQAMAKAL
jgi:cystathionine beta-lyase/cystathionine gamma-synthase